MDEVPDRGSPSRSTSERRGTFFADGRFIGAGTLRLGEPRSGTSAWSMALQKRRPGLSAWAALDRTERLYLAFAPRRLLPSSSRPSPWASSTLMELSAISVSRSSVSFSSSSVSSSKFAASSSPNRLAQETSEP